jgi:hypothetical protein
MKVIALIRLILTTTIINNPKELLSEQPEVITAVAPTFPAILIGANISGKTVIEATVNSRGEVASTQIVEGHPLIKQMTKLFDATLKRWRFSTTEEEGKMRKAKIVFVFTIVPERIPEEELTTVFRPPYEVEVRHRPYSESVVK